MDKRFMRQKGFTLTEIMVAIAIVGILAAIVLVSMGSYRKRARSAKLAGSLNSAVTSMQSCWTFAGGDIYIPASNSNICYLGSSTSQQNSASQYGKWPDLSQIGSDYGYVNNINNNNCATVNCKIPISFLPKNEPTKSYTYDSGFFNKKAYAAGGPSPTSGCFPKNGWFFAVSSASDNIKVCCNSAMKGCKVIDIGTNCSASIN